MAGTEEGGEGRIAVYEVTEYYCSLKPQGQCDQTIPSGRIISVRAQESSMQTYHDAFRNAMDGAPLCPVHQTQMVPQLIGMADSEFDQPNNTDG